MKGLVVWRLKNLEEAREPFHFETIKGLMRWAADEYTHLHRPVLVNWPDAPGGASLYLAAFDEDESLMPIARVVEVPE